MTKLSDNISLSEFIASTEADKFGIDNSLPDDLMGSAILTATAIQAVRDHINTYGRLETEFRVVFSSGYRSPILNKKIGGSVGSQHMKAEAGDIRSNQLAAFEIFNVIINTPSLLKLFDQVILEFGWVHVSVVKKNSRNEILLASKRAVTTSSGEQKEKIVYTKVTRP